MYIIDNYENVIIFKFSIEFYAIYVHFTNATMKLNIIMKFLSLFLHIIKNNLDINIFILNFHFECCSCEKMFLGRHYEEF